MTPKPPEKPRGPSRVRVTSLVTRVFGAVPAERGWVPALNCYQSPGRIYVCVDLAGVERASIEVVVQPGRLIVRGERATPEPASGPPGSIRCMEIDSGPFERTLVLPNDVSLDRVSSTYRDGLLWIELPTH